MFEVIKVFVPSLKWKVIPFRIYFWEERVGEVTAIFRVVAIVFIAASEVRVYDDRWHAFPDLRSCFMYVDGSYGRGKVRGTRFS